MALERPRGSLHSPGLEAPETAVTLWVRRYRPHLCFAGSGSPPGTRGSTWTFPIGSCALLGGVPNQSETVDLCPVAELD